MDSKKRKLELSEETLLQLNDLGHVYGGVEPQGMLCSGTNPTGPEGPGGGMTLNGIWCTPQSGCYCNPQDQFCSQNLCKCTLTKGC